MQTKKVLLLAQHVTFLPIKLQRVLATYLQRAVCKIIQKEQIGLLLKVSFFDYRIHKIVGTDL